VTQVKEFPYFRYLHLQTSLSLKYFGMPIKAIVRMFAEVISHQLVQAWMISLTGSTAWAVVSADNQLSAQLAVLTTGCQHCQVCYITFVAL